MPINKEIQFDLTDGHSDASISGVPIKKRLFHLSQSSSSTSQNISAMPKKLSEQPRNLLLKSESSVSENSAAVKLDNNLTLDDSLESSIRFNSSHGIASQVNYSLVLKEGTTGSGESGMDDDMDVDNRASLGLDMERGKNSPEQWESEMLKVEKGVGKIITSSDVSASQGVDTSGLYLSCQDKQYGLNLSKIVKDEVPLLDLPGLNLLQHLSWASYKDLESKRAQNWDLNFPMDMWNTNLDNLATNHEMNDKSKPKELHLPNNEKNPIQNTKETPDSFGLGSSVVESHQCNLRFTELGLPADGTTGYVDGLDLQLRLPSRPELHNLGITPLDLSLSLTGNPSDASSTIAEFKSCMNPNQNETRSHQLSSFNSGVVTQVKSEPCDRNFSVESALIEDSSLGKQIKPEPPEELQESPNLVLGNNQLGSFTQLPTTLDSNSLHDADMLHECSPTLLSVANTNMVGRTCLDLVLSAVTDSMVLSNAEDAPSTSCLNQDAEGNSSKPLDSNSLHDANMVHECSPTLLSVANTNMEGRTCLDLVLSAGTDSMVLSNADDVPSTSFLNQDAEGNSSKPLDNFVESIISDVKACTAEDTVTRDIGDKVSSLHQNADPKEPRACGELSGGVEMSLLDDASKCLGNSNLDSDPRKTNIVTGGNLEGMELAVNVQIEQYVVTAQEPSAPEDPKSARNKITSDGVGDDEDGVPSFANEVQCQIKKKLDASVSIASIGTEGFPFMTDVHADSKGEELQGEKLSGHSVEMCHEKQETTIDLKTDLHELPITAELTSYASEKPVEPFQGTRAKLLGREKVLKMNSCSINAFPEIAKNKNEYAGGQQMSTKVVSVAIKHPEVQDRESNVNNTATKHVYIPFKHNHIKHDGNRYKNRDSDKTSSPSTKSFDYRNTTSARSVPDVMEKERLIADNEKHANLYSQGRRHSKLETNNHDQTTGRCESDYMNNRRSYNHHFNRDPEVQYGPGISNPRKSRHRRHNEDMEIPFTGPPNDSCYRSLRRMTDYPLDRSSRFPAWRPSQGRREELSGRRQVRDIDANRIVGREIDDYLICKDKFASLPGEMVDSLLHSHPNLHYEPTENDFLLRGNSVSPTRSPVRLYRSRSPTQWFSPGRTPEMYIDDDTDLTARGPSLDRVDMIRNLSEAEITGKHTLLRYPQLQTEMREMHLARELDLARAGRVLRNRRYEMKLRENTEYPEPTYSEDQIVYSRDYDDRHGLVRTQHFANDDDANLVFTDDDHCPGSREYDDRHGFIQQPRRLPSTQDDNRAHIGDGYHRSSKFFRDSEMIHSGSSSRNFHNHERNQLGPNRLKNKVEQEEDYRYHRKQRRCDGGDVRLKRRKY
ncbi:uncharacterized protein LOC122050190 isoform X1 [Zingiber officinale]|uniref:uncharacterized protein LOC122050190 isoform X1 n=1 Tax=Zingiber officinale TaxID=94328 RepID=UPI001C4BC01C|nr:uncharacterized protein LOC122050190 isoform X1 [Zingiber officinale]XP_042467061.1 uncharacterized protein LOC122050190 isoform X1 [Zingiber officinale]XP_042467067.1 uncharacterized protein LOC122050190 isoform X1 [Zingiber officinale]XP_042467071.1 uncharacterized protein LOC122050190 isoform X1 [Zingiber officinale]